MASSHNITIHADTFAAVEALAAEKQLALDAVVEDAVRFGLDVLRQHIFFEERLRTAEPVTVEEARAILARAGRDNAPDPGDEIPEDLKHLYRLP